jgi:hypothetical protein
MFQPEPNTRLQNDDQISTPFSFIPPLPAFSFPTFWQSLPGIANYRLHTIRLVRLQEEIEQLKQIIGYLDSLLRSVNIKNSANCAGHPPTAVSASAYVPTLSGMVSPFNLSHSGVVVSSTYNRPAGSDGHGTVTVQHFGNMPEV